MLRFALPLVFAIAMLSLFLSPWALSKSAQYRQRLESRDEVTRVSPGNFNESASADRVFFVEAVSGDASRVKNVFVNSMQDGRLGIMAAAEGFAETSENGDRFLVLNHGRRYEGTPGTPAYRVMEFERYAVRIETREMRGLDENPGNRPLWELMRFPTSPNLGELVWRIGIPLAAINLVLLAIPLSFVNPRAGRATNLIFAILTYMTYSNLLSVSQAWVRQERLSFEIGLVAVHVVMLLILLLMFWRRLSVFSWMRLLR